MKETPPPPVLPQDAEEADYCLVEVSQVAGVTEKILADSDTPWKKFQALRRVSGYACGLPLYIHHIHSMLPQDSLTLSSRQRYFLRHRKGGVTSLYLGGVPKDSLGSKEKYTEYVKELVSDGECGVHC